MRRLVALLVIALVGATLFGLSNTSSGISVNGTSVSNTTFRAELSAISSSTTLQCYLEALAPANYAAGAGSSVATTGATAWADLRVEGLAIEKYARVSLKALGNGIYSPAGGPSGDIYLGTTDSRILLYNPKAK